MAITDEIREQQKKLAEMTWKEKWNYFWDYYKVHTLVAIAVVVLLIFFIKDITTGNQDSVFQVAIVNSEVQSIEETEAEKFGEYLGIDPKEEKVVFDNSYQINVDSADQMTVASSQKMVANAQLALIDMIMAPEDVMDYYTYNSFLCDIRTILPEAQFEKLDEAGRIFYSKTEEGKEIPVGIKVDDSSWVKKTGIYAVQKPILACVENTMHSENILKFIDYIYQE
ncbi:MAG: hypothetical protein PHS74_08125 [Lachnospiraceae bacterium]|nr:hypothetical protein [Lachnospiraceae bacterium]